MFEHLKKHFFFVFDRKYSHIVNFIAFSGEFCAEGRFSYCSFSLLCLMKVEVA